MQIPFAIASAQSDVLPWSAQRTVNMYAEALGENAQTKTRTILKSAPGLAPFSTFAANPVRGAVEFQGLPYTVAGSGLFRFDTDGSATSFSGAIGGTEAVSIATSANRMVLVANSDGWYFDGTTLTQIVDADFGEPSDVAYQDGFFVFLEDDELFASGVDAPDAYDALDFVGISDTGVKVISHKGMIVVFGQKKVQFYRINPANTAFPFSKVMGADIDIGCLAKQSVVQNETAAYFLATDRTIRRVAGGQAQKVSDFTIDQALATASAVSDCEAFAYTFAGHDFVSFTFPMLGRNWTFDASMGLWHERESFGLSRWRASHHVFAYGKHLVGSAFAGELYELDGDTYTEAGGVIIRRAVSAPIHAEGKPLTLATLYLDFERGTGLETGQGSAPEVMLRVSRDGGKTFGNELRRSLGALGSYMGRSIWRGLGMARTFVFEWTVSDPVKVAFMGAYADPVKR